MKTKTMLISALAAIILFGAAASAEEIGDVVNTAVRSDIVAYIFYQPIDSYNIDGYTYVRSADLRKYGFDVAWDADSKRVDITRNYDKLPVLIDEYKRDFSEEEYVPIGATTRPSHIAPLKKFEELNVLYTDINVYIEGEKANSYNIEGSTVIMIDELTRYGYYFWDEKSRTVTLDLDTGKMETPCYEVLFNKVYDMDGNEVDMELDIEWWHSQVPSSGGGIFTEDNYPRIPYKHNYFVERYAGEFVYYIGELKDGRPNGFGRLYTNYIGQMSNRGYGTYNGMFENGTRISGITTHYNSYAAFSITAMQSFAEDSQWGYTIQGFFGMEPVGSDYIAFNGDDSVYVKNSQTNWVDDIFDKFKKGE